MTTRSFIRALAVLSLLALFSLPISFGLLEKVWGVAEEGAAGGTLIVDLSPSVVAHGQALADDDDNSGDAADEGDTDDFGVLKISNGEGASRFLFYDGELSSQRPFRVPSLDPFFGGGELGDDPKGKEGGEGAGGLEGFGMTMKFRTMRRNSLWRKGSAVRSRYVTYGGPLLVFSTQRRLRSSGRLSPGMPAIAVTLVPSHPPPIPKHTSLSLKEGRRWFQNTSAATSVNLALFGNKQRETLLSTATRPLADLHWHHLALNVSRNGFISLYIDGELIAPPSQHSDIRLFRAKEGGGGAETARPLSPPVPGGMCIFHVGSAFSRQVCYGCDVSACRAQTFHGEIANLALWHFTLERPETLRAFGESVEKASSTIAEERRKRRRRKNTPRQRGQQKQTPPRRIDLVLPSQEDVAVCRAGRRARGGNASVSEQPVVLYLLGHLRNFPYTASISAYTCATKTKPHLTVIATPLKIHAFKRQQHATDDDAASFADLVPDSVPVLREWWDLVAKRAFAARDSLPSSSSSSSSSSSPPEPLSLPRPSSSHRRNCDILSVTFQTEAARAAALNHLKKALLQQTEKWAWAEEWGTKYPENKAQVSAQAMKTTVKLTAYRYQQMKEAHELGLQRFKAVFGREMPENHLVILSRPDIIMSNSIGEISPIVEYLNKNPRTVFGFWEANDYFEDRVVLTSRYVVDQILSIDHVCKWESTWLNSSSLLAMHVANYSEDTDPEWGTIGPSVLWDYLLDFELVADEIFALDSSMFGGFFQYRSCRTNPALKCAREALQSDQILVTTTMAAHRREGGGGGRGTAKEKQSHSCQDLCGEYGADTAAALRRINMSWVLEDRRWSWSELWRRRHEPVRRGYFPVIARASTKGYGARRAAREKDFPRERDFVRGRCLRKQ